jgi:hypothetical protein
MVLMLTTHPSRDGDILGDPSMRFSPGVDARDFFDPYGNICTGSLPRRACSKLAATLLSRTTGFQTRSARQRNSGM